MQKKDNQAKKLRKPLTLVLASPRGFCAGVARAILIVEKALIKYGAPIYVRHEIVHNRLVVEGLEEKGAIFVDTLDDVPEGAFVIFSAHGVPKYVPQKAIQKGLRFLDATCPLVSKVHIEALRHFGKGREVILIGHQNHPEVVGTMGQLPKGAIQLVETKNDIANVRVKDEANLAYITQTTLSVDDTKEMVFLLRQRFPKIVAPHKDDICYATTNRQTAIKEIAKQVDMLLVIGSPNSSNAMRLVETAQRAGCKFSKLIGTIDDVDIKELAQCSSLGLSAGASTPEKLLQDAIIYLGSIFTLKIKTITSAKENIRFKLPSILQEA